MTEKAEKVGEKTEALLKSQRASTRGCMTRIKTLIDQKAESLTEPELDCRLGILEAYFKQILAFQTDIEKLKPEDPGEAKIRGEIEDIYCATKSRILSLKADARKSSFSASMVDTNASVMLSPSTSHNLPKLKLPHFSGKYSDYPKFVRTFDNLVNKDGNLTIIEKFNHLVSCLSGPALRTIQALEVFEENYPKALERLKERFDNKCLIFQEHIAALFEMPKVTKNSADQLRGLVDTVNAHFSALLSLGSAEDIANAMVIHVVMSHLDSDSQSKWDEAIEYSTLPKWKTCADILSRRCQFLEARESKAPERLSKSTPHEQKAFIKRKQNLTSLAVTQARCVYCTAADHSIYHCAKFVELPVVERYQVVKKSALCINCLSKGHTIKKCPSSRCRVCAYPHHTLLHRYREEPPRNMFTSSPDTIDQAKHKNESLDPPKVDILPKKSSNSTISSSMVVRSQLQGPKYESEMTRLNSTHVFLATALIKIRDYRGIYHPARALLDSASQVNFISEDMAQRLGLKRERKPLNIRGIGEVNAGVRFKTQVSLRSHINDFQSEAELWILPKITEHQPERQVDIRDWNMPTNLPLADPLFYKPQRIDVLIGADLFFQLMCVGQIRLAETLPTLQKTVFGWIVSGRYQSQAGDGEQHCHLVSSLQRDEVDPEKKLETLVERFWELEKLEETEPRWTEEQQLCEAMFLKTVCRGNDGKFMVKLPFKDSASKLGSSFQIARNRFLNLERRFSRNPELKRQYSQFLKEYLDADHMELVAEQDIPPEHYFMPHQCVIRPDSSTTKLRVVFDASCRTSSQYSLNDVLMVGPTVQEDLLSIILRFRCHRLALTADISAMYRQILVQPLDRHFQYIIWRENPQDKLQIFRLKTVTYGTAPAPFLATRCLNMLADEVKESLPEAAQAIKHDFYMDDLISGAESRSELNKLRQEVEQVLQSAQFKLRKWYTNDLELLQQIPKEDREKPLRINDVDIIKTLGIMWDPISDELRFSQTIPSSLTVTKRTVLSALCSLFDPLGLINPAIVKAKIFLQELWLLKLNWDESLPQELQFRWRSFLEQLKELSKIRIPRYVLSLHPIVSTELHGFSDASSRAFGGCLYVRCEDQNGRVSVQLLSAKSRVAPCRPSRSLPCLKLCGAELLSKLLKKVQRNFIKPVHKVYLWTDSEIVLDWLAAHPSTWKTFVANRVSKIQELTAGASWRHVPSGLNPADILSRGAYLSELCSSTWFTGPEFLQTSQDCWPTTKPRHLTKTDLPEKRNLKSVLVCLRRTDLLDSVYAVSDHHKICQRIALAIRFSNNLKTKRLGGKRRTGPLAPCELRDALLRLVHLIQQTEFAEDIRALEHHREVSSECRSLNPFLESSMGYTLLRVGGRLKQADLPYDARFPILLPKDNPFVRNYVQHIHVQNYHAGPQALVAILRQQFWIVNARNYARKIVKGCIHCFRYKPKLCSQIMGNLPKDRITPAKPFSISGVDFFGPFLVTHGIRGRASYKAYVAIFVCFATKAVHMEIVSSLTSAAFIASLKRFVARRGLCGKLYCDNATNFVGANRELGKLAKELLNPHGDVQNWCTTEGIDFHHIPPRSPHFGGLWEAAVKSAKGHLYRTMRNQVLTYEELSTIVAQVEAILNSRPITALPTDPSDEAVLTPGHFLVGGPLVSIVEPDISEENMSRLTRWRRITAIQQHFWSRWSKEYLSQLQNRYRWKNKSPNVKMGAIVLIAEDNLPPQKWPLGRIVSVIHGEDGYIRVAEIKTKQGVIRRPIHKLAPLPEDD